MGSMVIDRRGSLEVRTKIVLQLHVVDKLFGSRAPCQRAEMQVHGFRGSVGHAVRILNQGIRTDQFPAIP